MHYTQNVYTEHQAREFLAQSDAAFDARIDAAISCILEKKSRFMCLSGPSCAGKTTTAIKITDKLRERGITTHVISIDDFFYNMDYLIKMSESKGIALDMDSPDTIDLATFSNCLGEIVQHGSTRLPIFDFNTHNRGGYRDFKCEKNDLIIFEGIQAVYPEITSLIAPYGMIRIFVCPEQAITVGDQVFDPHIYRFYRRIVRDAQYRAANAERTLNVWRGVRNNEDVHIFPHKQSCDLIIDSSMAYDLHLLTPYLRELLPQVSEQSRYYLRALDILNRIAKIQPIPVSYLQADSLYHEFIKF